MGIIRAFNQAVGGTISNQWLDVITAGPFDEHTVVTPGMIHNASKGKNNFSMSGVITNGSIIYVPENTVAFIYNNAAIENIITEAGNYEYTDGEDSVLNGGTVESAIVNEAATRFAYGGICPDQKQIAYVNMREIRGLKFGTRGPLIYNDKFYCVDLEIFAYGNMSVKVVNPELFVKNFVPPNTNYYSFSHFNAREQILSDFLQSFIVALNSLSSDYRLSEIPAQANKVAETIRNDKYNAGTWPERFGLELVKVSIENIEPSPESKKMIQDYSKKRMGVRVYEDVVERAAGFAGKQKEAKQQSAVGDAITIDIQSSETKAEQAKPKMSIDEQIATMKKMKDLLDAGILSEEEFNQKKKEIMGL